MRAQTAKHLSVRSAASIARKRADERAVEAAAARARARDALRVDVPRFMKRVHRQVLAASRLGKRTTGFDLDCENYPNAYAVTEAMKTRLLRLGYHVDITTESGTSDMGDSAAPCIIHYQRVHLEVSWRS
jgi:hypothetical protein